VTEGDVAGLGQGSSADGLISLENQAGRWYIFETERVS
jgi:hypothetical protein